MPVPTDVQRVLPGTGKNNSVQIPDGLTIDSTEKLVKETAYSNSLLEKITSNTEMLTKMQKIQGKMQEKQLDMDKQAQNDRLKEKSQVSRKEQGKIKRTETSSTKTTEKKDAKKDEGNVARKGLAKAFGVLTDTFAPLQLILSPLKQLLDVDVIESTKKKIEGGGKKKSKSVTSTSKIKAGASATNTFGGVTESSIGELGDQRAEGEDARTHVQSLTELTGEVREELEDTRGKTVVDDAEAKRPTRADLLKSETGGGVGAVYIGEKLDDLQASNDENATKIAKEAGKRGGGLSEKALKAIIGSVLVTVLAAPTLLKLLSGGLAKLNDKGDARRFGRQTARNVEKLEKDIERVNTDIENTNDPERLAQLRRVKGALESALVQNIETGIEAGEVGTERGLSEKRLENLYDSISGEYDSPEEYIDALNERLYDSSRLEQELEDARKLP